MLRHVDGVSSNNFYRWGFKFSAGMHKKTTETSKQDSCETNKNATQTLNLLREVYGVDALLRARMSE
jgi:hypothetical protein